MIRFTCPRCSHLYEVPDTKAGKKAHCQKCGQRFQIPVPPPNKTVLAPLAEHTPDPPASSLPPPGDEPAAAAPLAQVVVGCPGCGRAIPLRPDEMLLNIECSRCKTRFVPAQTFKGTRPSQQPPADPFDFSSRNDGHSSGGTTGRSDIDPFFVVTVVRPVLACIGALLLIVGQFCPMLSMPLGIRVTFFDYSTKTAWILSKAALKVLDAADDAEERPRRNWPREYPTEKRRTKPSDAVKSIALVVGGVLTLLSFFCPLVLVGMGVRAFLIVARGIGLAKTRTIDERLVNAGKLSLLALGILFLGPMILLWALPETGLAELSLVSTSFGFGWSLLLLGSIALLMSGKVQ